MEFKDKEPDTKVPAKPGLKTNQTSILIAVIIICGCLVVYKLYSLYIKKEDNKVKISKMTGHEYHSSVSSANQENMKTNVVISPPEFKGGMPGFAEYLKNNLVYPANARENGTAGRVVLSFTVEKDGSITDVKVLQGIGDGCDEAAVTVIQNSPAWKPGVQEGKAVRVKYTIPIVFSL